MHSALPSESVVFYETKVPLVGKYPSSIVTREQRRHTRAAHTRARYCHGSGTAGGRRRRAECGRQVDKEGGGRPFACTAFPLRISPLSRIRHRENAARTQTSDSTRTLALSRLHSHRPVSCRPCGLSRLAIALPLKRLRPAPVSPRPCLERPLDCNLRRERLCPSIAFDPTACARLPASV